jgi:hypothetical protein
VTLVLSRAARKEDDWLSPRPAPLPAAWRGWLHKRDIAEELLQ